MQVPASTPKTDVAKGMADDTGSGADGSVCGVSIGNFAVDASSRVEATTARAMAAPRSVRRLITGTVDRDADTPLLV